MAAMDTTEYGKTEYYCTFCSKECGQQAYFGGRWQKVYTTQIVDGKHRQLGEKKWLYLCRSCDFSSWRDFTKLEEFHDYDHRRAEYYAYFLEQLEPQTCDIDCIVPN